MLRSVPGGVSFEFRAALLPTSSVLLYGSGCLLFALALIFGGGTKQGLWSDALIEIASLPVISIAMWILGSREPDRVARYGILIGLAVVLIPLLELVPLPPWLWHMLPGRSQIAEEMDLAALGQTWQPLTLAPRECWMALLALLPAVASFLTTALIDVSRRRILIWIFLTWTCVGVVFTFLQMTGGPESSLRFYAQTNLDRGVGFFANANHNALALSLAVPVVMLAPFKEMFARFTAIRLLFAASALIVLIVAVSLTRSRAGIGLVFLAMALSGVVILLRTKAGRYRTRSLIIALGVAVLAAFVIFQTGFVAISDRFEVPLSEDLRWGLLHVSWNAALQFLPIGSGLGSFVPIYERFAPLALVHVAYVNHAHDDWIELLVELGILWPIMAISFLVWIGFAVRQQWRRHGAKALSRVSFCLIELFLAAAASAMDYPLRTIAVLSLFGMVCGLLIEPSAAEARPNAQIKSQ